MRTLGLLMLIMSTGVPAYAQGDVRVLATNKTSTMEKEMNEAAEAGYKFAGVMGGDTAFGGSEVVVLMTRVPAGTSTFGYKLLATSKTSTMQKEMQEAGDAGFEYKGQTVFKSTFGGKEVVPQEARSVSSCVFTSGTPIIGANHPLAPEHPN